MKRRGPQKHSPQKLSAALDLIRRGENPFRVAKQVGISRTTLLYHLERQPSEGFQNGANPVVLKIYALAEMYLAKAVLRLAKNIFHGSRKMDGKTSSFVLASLNKYPLRPPVRSSPFKRPAGEGAPVEDKVTFREFVIERRRDQEGTEQQPKSGLGETGLDTLAEREAALTASEDHDVEEP